LYSTDMNMWFKLSKYWKVSGLISTNISSNEYLLSKYSHLF